MSTVKVNRRAGVRIPKLGTREYGEAFEVDEETARELDKLPGLEWVKAAPKSKSNPNPVVEKVEDDAI